MTSSTKSSNLRVGRLLSTAIVISYSLLLLHASGCARPTTASTEVPSHRVAPRKPLVTVATVQTGRLETCTQFTGNVLPRRRTLIIAEVDGVVESMPTIGPHLEVQIDGKQYSEQLGILPGQKVEKGDVLVQLDRSNFELKVALAEAKLAKAQADLAKLKSWERPEAIKRLTALRDESQARYELATTDYERKKSLSSSRALSQSELDRAAMEVRTTKAFLDSHEATLRQATAGPTEEEIAVHDALVRQAEVELQQEQWLLSKTTIRAPYDGVITEINVEVGDHVTVSTGPLFELLDWRYLVAEVGVPESYLGKVRHEDPASVTISGTVDPVAGIVIGINDKVDPESRSFRVRIAIDNSEGRYKAGQFARVSMNLRGSKQEIVVPSKAIRFHEGEPGVFVFSEGQARRRSVVLGASNGDSTGISSGLKAGETIVVDDPSLLFDGVQVELRDNVAQRDAS